jgi:DNA-binding CsgD family transcriptional regulator
MDDTKRAIRKLLADPFAGDSQLSERERVIAKLAAEARTNEQIAAEVGSSPMMVAQYMRFILYKLGVPKKQDLTVLLLERIANA